MELPSKLSREEMKIGIVKSFYQIWKSFIQQSNQRTTVGIRFVEQNLPLRNECALTKSATERKGNTVITARTAVWQREQETRDLANWQNENSNVKPCNSGILLFQLDIRQKKKKKHSAFKKLTSLQCLLTELNYSKCLVRCIEPGLCSSPCTFGLDKLKPCTQSWRCLVVQTKATDNRWLD